MRAEDFGERTDGRAGLLGSGVVREQLGGLGLQRGGAARFEPDDGHPVVQPRFQRGQGPGHHPLGVLQLAGADPGQAAAHGLGRDLDPVAQRLQGGDGGTADAGFQVVGEGVGPQQQARSGLRRRRRGRRGSGPRTAAREPGLEGLTREHRDVAFRGDAAEPFRQRRQDRDLRGAIEERGAAGPADQAQPAGQPAQRVVRGGTAPPSVPLGQELGLVCGHVHADGTVAFAALAGQAEVEGAGYVVGVRRVHAGPAAGELEEQAGPAAGRVLLFAGGPVARAHHVAAAGQARPDADAAPGGRLQAAAVVGEGELGAGRGARSRHMDAQVGVEPPGPDHDARIHPVPRIPDVLELTERGDHLRCVHPRQQLRTGLPVTVLAGQRSPVCGDQVSGLLDKAPETGDAGRGDQVEVDPDMHAAVAEMPVVGAPAAVIVHQLAELPQIRPQLPGRHRSVFPAGPGLAAVRAAGENPGPSLPDTPEGPHLGRVGDDPAGSPGLRGAGGDGPGGGFGFGSGAAAGLDEQPAFAVRKQLVPLVGGPGRPQRGDQRHVHTLDGQRGQVQEPRCRVRRPERAGIAGHGQHPRGGGPDQVHGGFQHGDAAALGAGQRPGQVEAVLRQQLVQVVAGHPPGQLGGPGADQPGVAVGQGRQLAVDPAFLPGPLTAGGHLVRGGGAGREPGAVVGHDVQLTYVVHGLAPGHRVRAAGVVADHPAERAAIMRGRIGPEGEAVRRGRRAQVVQHHPGLDPRRGQVRVDAEHGPQVPGEVDDHGLVDRLAADARGGAARQHRHVVLPADLQRGQYVAGINGLNDPDRDMPVVGGVRGEHRPASGVETDPTPHPGRQVSRQGPG